MAHVKQHPVSASCFQGDKAARSAGLLLSAVSPFVVRRHKAKRLQFLIDKLKELVFTAVGRPTKSDILSCLPGMPNPGCSSAIKEASVVVFDMAAVIHMIKPHHATSFGEYADMQLLRYMNSQMTAQRDVYEETSLKQQTGIERGETSAAAAAAM